MMIIGSIWRYSHPVRVCAGDYDLTGNNTHLWTASGDMMLGYLIYTWAMIPILCVGCCLVWILFGDDVITSSD